MKILRIITRLNVGGPALQAISLTKELRAREHECTLVSGIVPREEGHLLEDKGHEELGADLHLQMRLKRELGWHDWYAFRAIRRKIIRECPDILHTHMSKAGTLGRLAVLSLPKRIRPKTVHTFHGHTFHSYFGKLKTAVFLNLERWLSRKTDAIVAISDSQKKELEEYGVRVTHVIPLGFDLDRLLQITPVDIDINDSAFEGLRIGFVGRLAPIKDVDLFVDFVLSIAKVVKVQCVWVAGDGPEKYKLKRLGKLLWEQRWVPPVDLPGFYQKCDIVICSSKNEGTPVALIEAMAAGCLVMSTPVGGCVELLNDKRKYSTRKENRGILFTRHSLQPCAEFLKLCLEDGSYKVMVENAREYVRGKHSLLSLIYNMEDLYISLFKGGTL